MQIFEYPYVIITIFVFASAVMGIIAMYFSLKYSKTANGTEEKDFLGLGKLEARYKKMLREKQRRCLIYVSVSLDNMIRFGSEAKAMRLLGEIRKVLLEYVATGEDDTISACSKLAYAVLKDCTEEEAEAEVEKAVEAINKLTRESEAVTHAKTRFGIYFTNSTEVNFDTAIARAKQACTMAENSGTDLLLWDNANGREFERKTVRENSIEDEIENNKFFLEYQPIIDSHTGNLVGAEVLARLNSLNDGIVKPNDFLDAVNNVGLTEKFDYYIFEKNCKWISNNKEQREKYLYTINFSRTTLCAENFAARIIGIADKYGLKPSCLAVEILEDKNIGDKEKNVMVENIRLLKERGFSILLDDFGGGYTSFTDLSNFDVSIVKIDKKIIRNAQTKAGFVILKNIIATAKDLGFKTLCEGVETSEHNEIAKEADCDMIQGFYYYKPMSVPDFQKLFE